MPVTSWMVSNMYEDGRTAPSNSCLPCGSVSRLQRRRTPARIVLSNVVARSSLVRHYGTVRKACVYAPCTQHRCVATHPLLWRKGVDLPPCLHSGPRRSRTPRGTAVWKGQWVHVAPHLPRLPPLCIELGRLLPPLFCSFSLQVGLLQARIHLPPPINPCTLHLHILEHPDTMAAADVSGRTGIPEPTYEPISAPGE